jgi:SAM-dependent methyltransferase
MIGKIVNNPKVLNVNYQFSKVGLDFLKFLTSIKPAFMFYRQYLSHRKIYSKTAMSDGNLRFSPQLGDLGERAGVAGGHYFWQDLLVAREIFKKSPLRHIDIGSRIDGFIAHLMVFRDVEIIDIRDMQSIDERMKFSISDAMDLSNIQSRSLESISSLHAIEHFGLGRYGDPLDANGHIKAIKEIQRVLSPGGYFYLSFPTGIPEILFNDKRVVDVELPQRILTECILEEFIAIPGIGSPIRNASPSNFRNNEGYCGLWIFRKNS